MTGKSFSIYIDESYPISMRDTAQFLYNVDGMFIAMAKGKLEEYFEYFPGMKAFMDLIHTWSEGSNVTSIDT